MDVTTCRLDGPVEFVSIGRFVSGPGWRHARRTIDSFELMFVRRGELPIRVGAREMHVGAGEIILLPAGVEHAGIDIITDDLEFYWMHVRLPATRAVSESDIPQDDRILIIPDRSRIPDPDRVAVLCGQMIDLYARFGPHRNVYCDYFATTLLLEISAQMRSVIAVPAQDAPQTGIVGIRTDGRPILASDVAVAGRWHGGVSEDLSNPIRLAMLAGRDDRALLGTGVGNAQPVPYGNRQAGLAPMLAVRAWIMANATDDLTVAGIAARFHYSPSYLTAMYKRVFGVGVVEQIAEYRIDRARELLSSTTSPVADIAREVGYADPKYFMRVFKRRTGLTPGQYRAAFPKRLYNSV
ncbi:AraC family transcriptional regulator [Bifidobacterium sp. SO1]|uniref:AraC family transcriptional regulator n=1 Tax=Bifidobacterium sp. SO1 TaxID=2809029 RepID=UPI001F0B495E|nr:AraC family transcriptional regulator [Bifidobacterium sp. SO1]